MSNFASRMMINILNKSASEQGVCLCNQKELNVDEYTSALVPISLKRDLLNSIVSKVGVDMLLQQDIGVAYYKDSPCIAVLLHNATPHSLVQRWQRLERYVHSNHYIRVVSSTTLSLTIEHKSQNDTPPTLAENMAVIGVLKSLLKQSGAEQVQLTPIAQPQPLDGSSKPFAWHFQWQNFIPSSFKSSLFNTTEEMLYASFPRELLSVVRTFGFDELCKPCLRQTANRLNLSIRSLQRKLMKYHFTFSKLVKINRVLTACNYLLHSKLPLSEIGFLSGFSDQPHFCRMFKVHVGMSPQTYRKIALN